jgi:tetratricopeptide (TPR) repeat protein
MTETSPSELLQARYGIVPYTDATGAKAELLAWLAGARPAAGRLVHGPGGLGKTRLMIEVAAELQRQGWTAGFLDRPHEQAEVLHQQALEQLIDHGDDSGLLIVMDYAEARQEAVKMIAARLAAGAANAGRAVRLVLLARSAADWWTRLYDETAEVRRVFAGKAHSVGAIELPAVGTALQRLALFEASATALAPLLKEQGFAPPAAPLAPARLARIESGAGYERPLAIQMEALLHGLSNSPAPETAGVDALVRQVLGAEREHWRKLAGTLDAAGMRDMERGVAQLTAVAGVPSAHQAERLLLADGYYAGRRIARADVAPVLGSLQRIYGRGNGSIAPLEPDLIGEHHVATVADSDLIEACLGWIDGAAEAERSRRRGDLLRVLQRATHAEHGGTATSRAAELLDRLVRAHAAPMAEDIVVVMMDTPGKLRDVLDPALGELDLRALRALDLALPYMHLRLMELALAVSQRHADLSRAALAQANGGSPDMLEAARSGYAAASHQLGIRLSNLGRREEALAAAREAVEMYRALAKEQPDAFLPYLAAGLGNLGNNLSRLGRREEALATSREAVRIYEGLAETGASVSDLARALMNLGDILADLGRREEALAVTRQAVAMGRILTKDGTDGFLRDLAGSLNDLGNRLSGLGRREEALAASREAVDIIRALAKERPDTFLPDLGASLITLGGDLSDLGQYEEALAASREAVDIRRTLVKEWPEAFMPELAGSLNNTGAMLSRLGRTEEALDVSREAADIFRTLAGGRPEAHLPDLAACLNNLGEQLSKLGRLEEALAASREAVDIRRALARDRPRLARLLPRLCRLPPRSGRKASGRSLASARSMSTASFDAASASSRRPSSDRLLPRPVRLVASVGRKASGRSLASALLISTASLEAASASSRFPSPESITAALCRLPARSGRKTSGRSLASAR